VNQISYYPNSLFVCLFFLIAIWLTFNEPLTIVQYWWCAKRSLGGQRGQRDEVMKSCRGEMLSMLWFSKANVKERQS